MNISFSSNTPGPAASRDRSAHQDTQEDWSYDPTGNWGDGTNPAYLTKTSGSTTLNQDRDHNVANDITETSGTAWPTPTHDDAGNLTKVPRPLSLGNRPT